MRCSFGFGHSVDNIIDHVVFKYRAFDGYNFMYISLLRRYRNISIRIKVKYNDSWTSFGPKPDYFVINRFVRYDLLITQKQCLLIRILKNRN